MCGNFYLDQCRRNVFKWNLGYVGNGIHNAEDYDIHVINNKKFLSKYFSKEASIGINTKDMRKQY